MGKLMLAIVGLGILVLSAAPAQAQATRTWVSGVGSDANPCSRTAPCKTFAGAISKTFINGEINCLDPGGFGAVTITKSITIDCHEVFASILASGVNGIIINIAVNANDPLRTVRIRNININGAGASGSIGTRTGLNGIRIDAALDVFIEDVMIDGFTQRGILDQRAAAGNLYVSNTTLRNMAGAGAAVAPSSGAPRIDATFTNVLSENNTFGIAIGSGARAMIRRSTLAGNTNSGLEVEGPAGAAEVNCDSCVISNNATGILVVAGGTARLSNSDVAFNTTAVSGAVNSFTNSRFSSNGSLGTITPIGAATTPTGQQ